MARYPVLLVLIRCLHVWMALLFAPIPAWAGWIFIFQYANR